jgi:hypothetical protein
MRAVVPDHRLLRGASGAWRLNATSLMLSKASRATATSSQYLRPTSLILPTW